jgi:hypothetical protein
VRKERLELSRDTPLDPKSSASTSSATFALRSGRRPENWRCAGSVSITEPGSHRRAGTTPGSAPRLRRMPQVRKQLGGAPVPGRGSAHRAHLSRLAIVRAGRVKSQAGRDVSPHCAPLPPHSASVHQPMRPQTTGGVSSLGAALHGAGIARFAQTAHCTADQFVLLNEPQSRSLLAVQSEEHERCVVFPQLRKRQSLLVHFACELFKQRLIAHAVAIAAQARKRERFQVLRRPEIHVLMSRVG